MSTLAQTNARWGANLRCAPILIAEEQESRLPLYGTEPWWVKLQQSGSFLFFYWLFAGRGARANILQLICSRDQSLTAQTHRKYSASEMLTWRSLPDAPSVQCPTRAEKFHAFVEAARSPLTLGAVAINVRIMREEEEHLAPGMQPSFTALYRAAVLQKESSVFFGKYLYPMLLRQDPRYHASTSDTIMGRATYAASRVLITRNDSGKRTVNTSYLLGVLTSAAVAAAYRPYWARSPSTTFKDLGSTIGSDAGINVLHEFWPGIRQVLKRHSPKFVTRIEKRITSDQTPPEVVST